MEEEMEAIQEGKLEKEKVLTESQGDTGNILDKWKSNESKIGSRPC